MQPHFLHYAAQKQRSILGTGLVLCLLLCNAAASAAEKRLHLYTATDLSPFSIPAGKDRGIAIDIVEQLAQQLNVPLAIHHEPWPRAQQSVAQGRNLLLLPLVRTPEREHDFLWIRPLMTLPLAFITINGRNIDLAKARELKTVLVQRGTPWTHFLQQEGFTNLDIISETSRNALKLIHGRGDAWFVPIIEAEWIWKTHGLTAPITIGPVVRQTINWLAMSPDSEPQLAEAVGKAMDHLQQNGAITAILARYAINHAEVSHSPEPTP